MSYDVDLYARLKSSRLVAFDTETTGLWAPSHRIVEIGAVAFEIDSDRTRTFASLVKPEIPIPDEVIGIHGITNDMVTDAPGIEDALIAFLEFCEKDSVLIAHNAPFDISFVRCELDRIGMAIPGNHIVDTADIYRILFPVLKSYSLEGLSHHFELGSNQTHRALDDAQWVRMLIQKAWDELSTRPDANEICKRFAIYSIADWNYQPKELPDKFKPLQKAIEDGHTINLEYVNSAGKSSSRTVRPLRIYQMASKCYLTGHCELANAERTFRFDRITKYEVIFR